MKRSSRTKVGAANGLLPSRWRPVFRSIEIRPDIGAPMAADGANEQRLQIGQTHEARPGIAADRYRVRAFVISAVNQQAANA